MHGLLAFPGGSFKIQKNDCILKRFRNHQIYLILVSPKTLLAYLHQENLKVVSSKFTENIRNNAVQIIEISATFKVDHTIS